VNVDVEATGAVADDARMRSVALGFENVSRGMAFDV